jgi:CDGSH-type Zn-finger protein
MDHTDPPAPRITVKPKGTIVLHGTAIVEDAEGNVLPIPAFKQPGVIKFCGCGRSKNRPFCDGSHKLPEGGSPPG